MQPDPKHTPGLWQVSVCHDVTGYPTYAIHGVSGDEKRNTVRLESNARLIAAAPELLEALKSLISTVDRIDDSAHDRIDLLDEADKARAAIRKATIGT